MTLQATITITMGISGPFLCSGTAPTSWGLDVTFDRDYLGRPYIDRSHIKGKLREAMEELGVSSSSISEWFGKEGPRENGCLFFSDLRLEDVALEKSLTGKPAEKTQTRIEKDNKRRVVKPNAMLVMENAFPGGMEPSLTEKNYTWTGTIAYVAAEQKEAENIAENILVGLKWITAWGAEKGIGFGRLKTASTALKTNQIDLTHTPETVPTPHLTLTITTEEPLMLGDIRIKANYQESMEYITGNSLKGALAQAVNMACGVSRPAATPINKENTEAARAFPLLSKYFGAIRFTHAFPSTTEKRPVVIPYSIVSVDGVNHDMALNKDTVLFGSKLPAFQSDWKDDDYPEPDVFGWASPLKFTKTRTAIDDDSHRAEDGNMFTYQYVCPCDEDRKPISWIGGVYLNAVSPEHGDTLADIYGELKCAVELLRYLGKRGSRVKATLTPRVPIPYKTAQSLPQNNMAIVALQSDALMVQAEDLLKNGQTANNLWNLYNAYWVEITKGICQLSHFFAMQKLRGGFLRRNKTGTGKPYYPYYLTEAGSVFVLKITEPAGAQELFNLWDKTGLPLPQWSFDAYGVNGVEIWRQCPYIPENGFGEVTINLDVSAVPVATEGGVK